MIARIVYYKPNSLPEEEIVVVNSFEKAVEIARRKIRMMGAVKSKLRSYNARFCLLLPTFLIKEKKVGLGI